MFVKWQEEVLVLSVLSCQAASWLWERRVRGHPVPGCALLACAEAVDLFVTIYL